MIRVSFPSVSQFSVRWMQAQNVHAFVCILVTRSPEMSQPLRARRERERESEGGTEPNIFHHVNRSRNPNSHEKVSSCQSNQSLRKHPTQRSSRHNCQLPRRRRSQIAQIHEPCGKNGCSYSANGNLACAPRNCLIHFLFLWPLTLCADQRGLGGVGGGLGDGERAQRGPSGAVNCVGVLIQRCNGQTGIMLPQRRRYAHCRVLCHSAAVELELCCTFFLIIDLSQLLNAKTCVTKNCIYMYIHVLV